MKRVALALVAGLVLLSVGLWLLLPRTAGTLRAKAVSILEACRKGRAAGVHATFRPEFRKAVGRDEFVRFLEYRRRTLGEFREAGDVERMTHARRFGVDTCEIVLPLRYGKGETRGTFLFADTNGDWVLLSMTVPVPAALDLPPDLEALKGFLDEVVDLYNRRDIEAIYERFSPPLRKKCPVGQFLAQTERFRGDFGRIEDARLRREAGGKVARLEFALRFESERTGIAEVECFWKDGRWSFLVFRLMGDE
ncbi:MAG: hypothetical protein ACYTAF_07110 [Planctomycetota bacterium]|jgi:hypothetical protein